MSERSTKKVEMKEKECEEDRKEEGNKEVIEERREGKGVKVEEEKGKSEGENSTLKSYSTTEIGAQEIGGLRGKGHFFKKSVWAFREKNFEFLVEEAIKEKDPKCSSKAKLKTDVGEDERVE